MAQYRYAAQIIGRSSGRSAVAAAAYRAAEALHDARTGIIHDYSRKRGVEHTAILTPEGTPDWMKDRHRLWNAVETAEKRKDSQLAREVLLSLPHEISQEDRVRLVHAFVIERFVDKGLIADIAIHAPDPKSDERNWHAHIMLTMRSLTSEGFGPKLRPTKDRKAELVADREAWAHHQNRLFERRGLPQRVDHRSYEDQGIDRMPTVHLGPHASAMEKENKPSRRGDLNRDITAENSRIAQTWRERANDNDAPLPPRQRLGSIPEPAPVFNYRAVPPAQTKRDRAWAQRDWERVVDLQTRENHALLDLDHKQHPKKIAHEADLERRYGVGQRTMKAEIAAIDARMKATGFRKIIRWAFGAQARDTQERALYVKALEANDRRQTEERRALEIRHHNEKLLVMERYKTLRAKLERTLALKAEQRQDNRMDTRKDRLSDEHARAQARNDKAPDRQTERPDPKPEPHLKPQPPKGAGRELMPRGNEETYDRIVRETMERPENQAWWNNEPKPAPARDAGRAWWNEPTKEKSNEPTNDRKPERDRD